MAPRKQKTIPPPKTKQNQDNVENSTKKSKGNDNNEANEIINSRLRVALLPKPSEKKDDSTSTENPSDTSDDEEDDKKQAKQTPNALKTPPCLQLQQQSTKKSNATKSSIDKTASRKIYGLVVMKVSKHSLLCNASTACF